LGTGRLVLSTDHVEAGRLVGAVTRIVTTACRYKRPPRKRKLALAGPAVITMANKRRDPEPANPSFLLGITMNPLKRLEMRAGMRPNRSHVI
jgi:hypothetical protein